MYNINYSLPSFTRMKLNQFLERLKEFAHTLPEQFFIVQHTVRICIKQLKDLSYPPFILLDFIYIKQSDAERSEFLVVKRFFSINVKSRQHCYQKRPKIVIHLRVYMHYVVLRARLRYSRSHDCRCLDCYSFHSIFPLRDCSHSRSNLIGQSENNILCICVTLYMDRYCRIVDRIKFWNAPLVVRSQFKQRQV